MDIGVDRFTVMADWVTLLLTNYSDTFALC